MLAQQTVLQAKHGKELTKPLSFFIFIPGEFKTSQIECFSVKRQHGTRVNHSSGKTIEHSAHSVATVTKIHPAISAGILSVGGCQDPLLEDMHGPTRTRLTGEAGTAQPIGEFVTGSRVSG